LQDYFGGYERESNYLYLPVGIEIITGLKNNWCWGAAIEYDYFLSGKQKSHLSDFDPGLNDIDNKQDKGYGLRGVVKFVRKGQRVNFFMEPFIRYWKIEESDRESAFYYGNYIGWWIEPKNKSTEIGCNIGISF